MQAWVDGQGADTRALQSRGLAYGDGLFETIAVKAGKASLLDYHLDRLALGCQRLAIEADLQLIRDECCRYAVLLGDGVLKLILTRGDSQRGYAAVAGAMPRRILQGNPVPVYPSEHADQGVSLFPCRTRLAEQPLLAGLKHLNRLEQVLARAEWQGAEYAEGLMLDMSGRVIEGVYSNLFLVHGGQLLTADLSRCGVAGVMRAALLDAAGREGIGAQIRDLALDDLEQADELFLCNSVYGVWPVRSFASLNWSPGPLTRKLQAIARTLLDA
ncbi:aminodeoxychorismate lyase [Pseudomonas putida]|uniref:Aminodeoxychorismate lyase n=1 Tax=Pseudomonas putida TaxID=303 RepID=A0A177S8M3_PSEPU|nr:aminodeoxychorismate lyase [Pseudomonas putida]OAI83722.1 aminodeoxychorismate lyase [Pseudomonas putida]